MKYKIIMLLVICFLLNSCNKDNKVITNEEISQIKVEIQDAFQKLIVSSKLLNADEYIKHFDESCFIGLKDDGKVLHSLKELDEMYRHQIPMLKEYKSLTFDNVKIEVLNREVAILVNEYKAEVILTNNDIVKATGGGTQVWRKKNNTWKLVSVSSSS